jgi:polyisoprenoid-binding protein YceI
METSQMNVYVKLGRGMCLTVAIAFGLWVSINGAALQKTHTYKIIAAESNLWVYVAKGGLLSALAHNHNIGVRSFSGTVTVPEGGASGAALTLEIDAASLNVADKDVSDKDRTEISNSMHNEVLQSVKYAKITFKSAGVSEVKANGGDSYSFTVSGDLTLHGVTKRVAIPVTATITARELKASGKYTLKQSLFGIAPYSKAGGAVKVKDDVIVNFNIVAQAS